MSALDFEASKFDNSTPLDDYLLRGDQLQVRINQLHIRSNPWLGNFTTCIHAIDLFSFVTGAKKNITANNVANHFFQGETLFPQSHKCFTTLLLQHRHHPGRKYLEKGM